MEVNLKTNQPVHLYVEPIKYPGVFCIFSMETPYFWEDRKKKGKGWRDLMNIYQVASSCFQNGFDFGNIKTSIIYQVLYMGALSDLAFSLLDLRPWRKFLHWQSVFFQWFKFHLLSTLKKVFSPSLNQTDCYVSLDILKESKKYLLVQLFRGKAER